MNKDLKVLSKDRKDELNNSKCYLDIDPSQSSGLALIIDMKLPYHSDSVEE